MGLFRDNEGESADRPAPLADRMRPSSLDDFVGHGRIVGPGTALRRAIEEDDLGSLIFWGPPGCGKTTLARIIAHATRAEFVRFSAVLSGVRELRGVMQAAARARSATGRRTILFIDEIHRFNKAQQDAFLPFVEDGTIVLIGATTENPSFEVNSALLSRSRVYRLDRLSDADLLQILRRVLDDSRHGLGRRNVRIDPDLLRAIAAHSQGDARAAMNVLEFAAASATRAEDGSRHITRRLVEEALQRTTLYYDRAGEEHFNLISALHKSMRNSDPDASLYWLARMLDAGEDPLYIARRIVRFASEDVGLADPRALSIALSAKQACHFIGLPEGELALAEATVFCALAPKSNALYKAWGEVRSAISDGATDPVPLPLRNAPTELMKEEGYGAGYEYAHDRPDAVTALECLPERLRERQFYEPTDRGFERELGERLRSWRQRRRRAGPEKDGH